MRGKANYAARCDSAALPTRLALSHAGWGAFCPVHIERGMTVGKIAEWRALGEIGQFFVGLFAGFTPQEIAKKREWTTVQRRKIQREASEYLRGEHQ